MIVKMEFVKEKSEDMSDEEACREEDTKEQIGW